LGAFDGCDPTIRCALIASKFISAKI
jgi:hypothetical protein